MLHEAKRPAANNHLSRILKKQSGFAICLLIVLILGAGVFGLVGLIGVVRLVDLVAAVQAGGHIAAIVDDIAVLVLMLARRHLAVAVALDGGILLASPAWWSPPQRFENDIK